MTDSRQDVLLGLLFFATLIGLGAMTIVLSDFRFGVTTHEVELLSPDVGFLRPGDPVLVSGMNSGKVRSIARIDPPRYVPEPGGNGTLRCDVQVICRLDLDLYDELRRDHRIVIEDRGVLGGKLIRVESGEAPDLVSRDAPLVALASASVLQAAGAILEENKDSLRKTIDNLQSITSRAAAGEGPLGKLLNDDDLAERVDRFVTNLTDLSDQLAAGDGTLGKLLKDQAMYDTAQAFLADMRELSDGLVKGEGTLGKLLKDDGSYNDLQSLLTDLRDGVGQARDMLTKLSEGEGTLGKLITDDSLHADASQLMKDLASLSADLREGKGTMGRLFNDETLYDNANEALGEIRGAVTSVTKGDGLLPVLLNDTQLADDFRSILKQVLGAIEDARETTPVQSLGSFLFGTF